MDERIKKATADALFAFWAEFSKQFPEADTGDIDPETDHAFNDAAAAAARSWVRWSA